MCLLKIRARPPTNAGTTALGCAGSDFPSTRNPGFDNRGPAEQEALTGNDANGAREDAYIQFNFARNFGLGDNVGSNQDDFEATAIHEFLHSLGWLAGILADGTSEIGRGDNTVWGKYDQYVADSSGVSFVDPTTFQMDVDRWNAAKTTALTFNGPQAVAANGGNPVPLFAPSTFSLGDSVSHVNDLDPGISASTHIMVSNGQFGLNARELHPVERAILQDLGFQMVGDVTTENLPPTISSIADQTTTSGVSTSAITFVVGDDETAAVDLEVTATSDDATLLPTGGIVLAGSGADRTIMLTPAAGQTGTATITVTVTDEENVAATETFDLTVSDTANTAPTISAIDDQTTTSGVSTSAITFMVSDAETAAADLTVTATADDTTLLPTSGIVLAGSGADRTIMLTPAAGQTGTATITVTVTDAENVAATETFDLTVSGSAAADPVVTVSPRVRVAIRIHCRGPRLSRRLGRPSAARCVRSAWTCRSHRQPPQRQIWC